MMAKFWEGLGDKLSAQWVATILTPAFVFWWGALVVWITRFGWIPLETWYDQLRPIAQGVFLIGALLGVVVSSLVIQQLELPVLRFLEGYWPRWFGLSRLRVLAVRFQNWRLSRIDQRLQRLMTEQDRGQMTPEKYAEYVVLDVQLGQAPDKLEDRMPTKLGNILRAAELKPLDRYGLDTIICWPHLWLLLPNEAENKLSEARATLDTATRILIWSVLFIIWIIWTWWALLVGLIVAIWAYSWLLRAAQVYGDLLVAAFDLYRPTLYETLRLPLPEDSASEKQLGEQLTLYLFRGGLPTSVKFQNREDNKKSP